MFVTTFPTVNQEISKHGIVEDHKNVTRYVLQMILAFEFFNFLKTPKQKYANAMPSTLNPIWTEVFRLTMSILKN